MQEHLSKRGKVAATLMAILLVITFTAALLPIAAATPTIDSVDPESGHVGNIVRVVGKIDTENGSYNIFFDGEERQTGTAVGTTVNDTFKVPYRSLGNYSVMLQDVTTKDNYTFPVSFAVETAYYVKAAVPSLPQQLQEGEPTKILVNVTGGEANTVYSANITVTDPSGAVYPNYTLQLTNTTNTGQGEGNITYPANFAKYVGLYSMAFNGSLATGNFTVGLTDKTEYRRMRTVNIQGSGYVPDELVHVNITFAGAPVAGFPQLTTANAEGVVTYSWQIPNDATPGVYTVTLTNATGFQVKLIPDVQNFTVVETIMRVRASADPTRIQEGLNTTITVAVNEGEANATLAFMVNVTDPKMDSFTKTINVSTNATGSGSNSVLYYGDFSAGANTSYVGTYNISVVGFNEILATGNFTVGLTDKSEYGRTETGTTVSIQGVGYVPDELVHVNITFAGAPVAGFPQLTTANAEGVVTYFWQIPKDAQLGTYTLTLTNETEVQVKPVPDIQNFTVIELIVHCQTQNKYDGHPLAGVTVQAHLNPELVYPGPLLVESGKTNKTGFVDLRLDFGNYNFTARWRGEEVGILENQSVTRDAPLQFLLECELASVTIAVNDEAGHPLPFINLTLTSNATGSLLLPETDSTGTATTNAFTDISYRIEARRYGYLFSNQSIGNLTVHARINITCPTYTLLVDVLDSSGLPLQNVEVVVYEWSSERVAGSGTTDVQGNVALDLTFGRYRITVCNYSATWSRLVAFNETVRDLIEDQQSVEIRCRICNLELSVVVTDYFGQPISNAMVRVEREFGDEYVYIDDLKTGSGGTVVLPKIGGRYRISVHVGDKLFDVDTLYLDESKVIEFRIDKLVVVAGYPLEFTQFLAFILLVIMVIVFASAFVYRRLRLRKVREGEEKEKSL